MKILKRTNVDTGIIDDKLIASPSTPFTEADRPLLVKVPVERKLDWLVFFLDTGKDDAYSAARPTPQAPPINTGKMKKAAADALKTNTSGYDEALAKAKRKVGKTSQKGR